MSSACQIKGCAARWNTIAVIDCGPGDQVHLYLCQGHGDVVAAESCRFRPEGAEWVLEVDVMPESFGGAGL